MTFDTGYTQQLQVSHPLTPLLTHRPHSDDVTFCLIEP